MYHEILLKIFVTLEMLKCPKSTVETIENGVKYV